MPRKPRMFVAGTPCHVIQRGNNRSVCFFEAQNYQFYLHCLKEACIRYDVALHAYVLMTNHVHLLMTPSEQTGVSRVMQSIGRRYVQYINSRYNRTGTLFEGRFKASLVQQDAYFLMCMRYIELNPVRANMVLTPAQYTWSSFHENTGMATRHLVRPHYVYLALASERTNVEQSYLSLFENEMTIKQVSEITNAWQFNMPYGSKRFLNEIELTLNRRIGFAKKGRPAN